MANTVLTVFTSVFISHICVAHVICCCLVAKSCLTICNHLQPSATMGFPRQEYWRGLPSPSPGDLPNPGIKPVSHASAGGFFTAEPPGKHIVGVNE